MSYPLFYETQSYELVIEKKQDIPLSFYHENVHIRQAVKPLGRGNIFAGILNFQNEVGLTDLGASSDMGRPYSGCSWRYFR